MPAAPLLVSFVDTLFDLLPLGDPLLAFGHEPRDLRLVPREHIRIRLR